MPAGAPAVKRRRAAALGATIVDWHPGSGQGINELASGLAAESGRPVVHSYDDLRSLAGAGTVGLEILEDLPSVGAILVPIGGGGLASGLATIVRARSKGILVIGVEPELASDVAASFPRGPYTPWPDAETHRTIADGLRANACELTFAHIRRLVDAVITVSDDEIAEAVRAAAEQTRLVLEPAGATALAGWLFRAADVGLGTVAGDVVVVASGGNVDPDRYQEYLSQPRTLATP
jgi:threonine dehydratase